MVTPLGTLRQLVKQIWMETDLEGMVWLPQMGVAVKKVLPRYSTDISLIDEINPFNPLMEVNCAKLIPGLTGPIIPKQKSELSCGHVKCGL